MERTWEDMLREQVENEDNAHSQKCWVCDGGISVLTPPALQKMDICSWRCWKEGYGEEG